jgi:hypothetical protein
VEEQGEIPSDSPFGGGDYLEIDVCLDCGKAQGIENMEDPQFYTDTMGDLEEEEV